MKNLVALCPYVAYRNEQLLKDCILIPYTFMTHLGYDVTVMTAQKEEFTYLNQLPGLRLDVVPTCPLEQWADYLVDYLKNYPHEIDVLFLFGMRATYYPVVKYFKNHYQGKIILKADANSQWVGELINPSTPQYDYLIHNCDIITCEGVAMQNYLAKKWRRPIDLFRNGSRDVDFNHQLTFNSKEELIVNVGIQETGRKNTPALIKTFAQLAPSFPTWRLALIGTYEPAIKSLVERYYQLNPQLKKQLLLTGPITDKKLLESYYAKAKIFVTASYLEGGSPNVVAEALRNGCYLITSKIDAWQDTFAPEAGASFDHGNLVALTAELRRAMSDPKLCQQAFTLNRAYVQAELSYEQQVSRLETLLKVRGKLNDKN